MAEENSVTFSAPEQVTANDRPAEEKQTPVVDAEAIAKMLDEKLSKFADEFGRQQQGLRRKQEDRIAKLVNGAVAAQREAGVEVTNEQSQALESYFRKQVEADESPAVEPPAPPKADKGDSTTDHVNRTIQKIYDKMGLRLEKNDPEAEGLDKVADPYEFIEEVRARVERKAKRISVSPETRLPGMGAGLTPGSESKETLGAKLDDLLRDPTKNWKEIQEVKAKLKPLLTK